MHLFQRDPVLGNHSNIYILGIHVAHGDLQIDTLSDIAFLLRHRPWGSRVLVAGDWNIDQLPPLAIDPFSDHPGRDQHHQAERVLVQSLVDRFHLSLFVPEVVCSTPGGPFDDACRASPITRIPVGEAASYCSPSLLDYAAASENLVTESRIHWHGVPADHALVTFSISPVRTMMRNTKTTWKCRDEDQCISWVQANAPTQLVDLASFHSFISSMQTKWADVDTCKGRHEARLPPDLRSLYAQVGETRDELQRRHLQKIAWGRRKQWFLELGSRQLCDKVRKGRVI